MKLEKMKKLDGMIYNNDKIRTHATYCKYIYKDGENYLIMDMRINDRLVRSNLSKYIDKNKIINIDK